MVYTVMIWRSDRLIAIPVTRLKEASKIISQPNVTKAAIFKGTPITKEGISRN